VGAAAVVAPRPAEAVPGVGVPLRVRTPVLEAAVGTGETSSVAPTSPANTVITIWPVTPAPAPTTPAVPAVPAAPTPVAATPAVGRHPRGLQWRRRPLLRQRLRSVLGSAPPCSEVAGRLWYSAPRVSTAPEHAALRAVQGQPTKLPFGGMSETKRSLNHARTLDWNAHGFNGGDFVRVEGRVVGERLALSVRGAAGESGYRCSSGAPVRVVRLSCKKRIPASILRLRAERRHGAGHPGSETCVTRWDGPLSP